MKQIIFIVLFTLFISPHSSFALGCGKFKPLENLEALETDKGILGDIIRELIQIQNLIGTQLNIPNWNQKSSETDEAEDDFLKDFAFNTRIGAIAADILLDRVSREQYIQIIQYVDSSPKIKKKTSSALLNLLEDLWWGNIGKFLVQNNSEKLLIETKTWGGRSYTIATGLIISAAIIQHIAGWRNPSKWSTRVQTYAYLAPGIGTIGGWIKGVVESDSPKTKIQSLPSPSCISFRKMEKENYKVNDEFFEELDLIIYQEIEDTIALGIALGVSGYIVNIERFRKILTTGRNITRFARASGWGAFGFAAFAGVEMLVKWGLDQTRYNLLHRSFEKARNELEQAIESKKGDVEIVKLTREFYKHLKNMNLFFNIGVIKAEHQYDKNKNYIFADASEKTIHDYNNDTLNKQTAKLKGKVRSLKRDLKFEIQKSFGGMRVNNCHEDFQKILFLEGIEHKVPIEDGLLQLDMTVKSYVIEFFIRYKKLKKLGKIGNMSFDQYVTKERKKLQSIGLESYKKGLHCWHGLTFLDRTVEFLSTLNHPVTNQLKAKIGRNLTFSWQKYLILTYDPWMTRLELKTARRFNSATNRFIYPILPENLKEKLPKE